MKWIIALVFFSSNNLSAQTRLDSILSNPVNNETKIADSLLKVSYVSFKFQYLQMVPNGLFTLEGTNVDVGLNIARFFTQRFILGIGIDLKYLFHNEKITLSSEQISNFNSNYMPQLSNQMDSIRSISLNSTFNNVTNYNFSASRFSHVCLNFSPFPTKYGGLMFQLKLGNSTFVLKGPLGDLYNKDSYHPILSLYTKKNIGFEISMRPYLFFKNTQDPDVFFLGPWYKFLTVSLYAERFTLKNATFGGERLDKFVQQEFINKYKGVQSFGIKLGFEMH
jgi:hypothetical protein